MINPIRIVSSWLKDRYSLKAKAYKQANTISVQRVVIDRLTREKEEAVELCKESERKYMRLTQEFEQFKIKADPAIKELDMIRKIISETIDTERNIYKNEN